MGRHNEIPDITSDRLNGTCTEVETVPQLQAVNGEHAQSLRPKRHEARADAGPEGLGDRR